MHGDVSEISTRGILKCAGLRKGEIALVSAGPPCQPFSKAAFWFPDRFTPYRRDKRRSLLKEFARVVIESKARAFLLENVAGLAYSTNYRYLEFFKRMLKKQGYTLSCQILNAAK